MTRDEKGHYLTLDAMRGVAAIAVLLYHSGGLAPSYLARSGYLAVDFFFVLSGFVIAKAYDHRLGTDMSAPAFFGKRFLRLFPLAALGVLLAAPQIILQHQMGLRSYGLNLLAALLFLPCPIGPTPFVFNNPRWSLFFELGINVAYGAPGRRLSSRVWIGALVLGAVGLIIATLLEHKADVGWTWPTIWGGGARVLFSFPLGVLLYRHRELFPNLLSRMHPIIPALLLFGLLMVRAHGLGRVSYDLVFILFISPALVMAGASVEPNGVLGWIYRQLGLLSFSLYAIHWPLVQLVKAATLQHAWPQAIVGPAFVVGVIGLALVADRIDGPARRWMSQSLSALGQFLRLRGVEG